MPLVAAWKFAKMSKHNNALLFNEGLTHTVFWMTRRGNSVAAEGATARQDSAITTCATVVTSFKSTAERGRREATLIEVDKEIFNANFNKDKLIMKSLEYVNNAMWEERSELENLYRQIPIFIAMHPPRPTDHDSRDSLPTITSIGIDIIRQKNLATLSISKMTQTHSLRILEVHAINGFGSTRS